MPSIELTDEELQGFVQLCATASGPGINWVLTNALLTKARQAQEVAVQKVALQKRDSTFALPMEHTANSEDHDAKAVL